MRVSINSSSRCEACAAISDGDRRRIGPGDLVLLEDTYGKGHVTRLLSPVTCLFLRVEGDFDVEACEVPAREEAAEVGGGEGEAGGGEVH